MEFKAIFSNGEQEVDDKTLLVDPAPWAATRRAAAMAASMLFETDGADNVAVFAIDASGNVNPTHVFYAEKG